MNKAWLYLALAIELACLLAGCGMTTAAPPTPTEKASVEKTPASDSGGFSIDLLSAGKSDCAIIRMDGFVILNDTADEDDYEKIASALKAGGVTRIDYMILSHYDKDHIGSAASIIRNFEIGMILRPDYAKESERYNALVEAENAANVPVVILKKDYSIATANGSITVDPPKEDYGDDNNNSAITTVTYRGHRLLFPGDAKKKRLEAFSTSFQHTCDFIKLPHHGDGNKALYSLVRDCAPRWAVATVASSGDVEPKLTKTLEELGVALYCTSDGPVRISWNGEALEVSQNPE